MCVCVCVCVCVCDMRYVCVCVCVCVCLLTDRPTALRRPGTAFLHDRLCDNIKREKAAVSDPISPQTLERLPLPQKNKTRHRLLPSPTFARECLCAGADALRLHEKRRIYDEHIVMQNSDEHMYIYMFITVLLQKRRHLGLDTTDS